MPHGLMHNHMIVNTGLHLVEHVGRYGSLIVDAHEHATISYQVKHTRCKQTTPTFNRVSELN